MKVNIREARARGYYEHLEEYKKRECKFMPCHDKLEDCTYCWCPFYNICPSITEGSTGGYMVGGKKDNKVWACNNCNYIHRSDVAAYIKERIGLTHRREFFLEILEKFPPT